MTRALLVPMIGLLAAVSGGSAMAERIANPIALFAGLDKITGVTTSFVRVDQVEMDNTRKPIFSGWMFAESPGLNAMEHATYDVWLTGCRDPNAPPPAVETAPVPDANANPDQPKEDQPED